MVSAVGSGGGFRGAVSMVSRGACRVKVAVLEKIVCARSAPLVVVMVSTVVLEVTMDGVVVVVVFAAWP